MSNCLCTLGLSCTGCHSHAGMLHPSCMLGSICQEDVGPMVPGTYAEGAVKLSHQRITSCFPFLEGTLHARFKLVFTGQLLCVCSIRTSHWSASTP